MSSAEERCVIMDTERYECTDTCEYPDGNWIVVPCTETHPYMCKVKKGLTTNTVYIDLSLIIFILFGTWFGIFFTIMNIF